MNIIITGGNRGLGLATAHAFAAKGHNLMLCARNEPSLNIAKETLENLFPRIVVEIHVADLSNQSEVEIFAKKCLNSFLPDVLVNNAGGYIPGNCSDAQDGDMEKMMAMNFYTAYHLTRAILPAMIQRKSGHIFNMCSIAALQPYDGGGCYSISKYALDGFSKNLRHELKSKGIKVTTVYPGATLTDSWGDYDNSQERIMIPSDVAHMIVSATELSNQAVVEEIILRPQLGDL
jgi:short-subunit dehydrogenase